MKCSGNFIVLFQSRAAAQNLGKPELPNGTLHVANLALSWGRSLDPLRRLATNAADHVGMCKRLGSSLLRLYIQSRRNRLRDARVQRGSTAGNKHVGTGLVARAGPAITVTSPRTGKGRMGIQRWSHCERFKPMAIVVECVV